jgi:type IX secretion system PorP/SprF family membrane protein
MILPLSIVLGQDVVYTQFSNTPIFNNPSLTGAEEGLHTYTLGRLQWMNLPVHYNAVNFEGDFGIRNIPVIGGFGLFVNENNEGIGFIKDLQIGVSFSSRIKVSSLFVIQIGIKASLMQKEINWDDFVFTDQLSERYGNVYASSFTPPDISTKTFMDFGFGGLFQYRNRSSTFQGSSGFAVDHLFEPDQSFLSTATAPLSRKYIIHSDFLISTNECSTCKLKGYGFKDPIILTPGFLYQLQNNMNTIQVGFNLIKFNFSLGFWYRYQEQLSEKDIFSILFGYRIFFSKSSFMKLTYSLDLGNKQLSGTPVYAHEFCLTLNFTDLNKERGNKNMKKLNNKTKEGLVEKIVNLF